MRQLFGRNAFCANARHAPAGEIDVSQRVIVTAAQAEIVTERRSNRDAAAVFANQLQPLHRAHGEVLRAQVIHR